MIVGGFDEAGRGPALGPLAMALVFGKEEDFLRLKFEGIKDSKSLSKYKRERLFDLITDSPFGVFVSIITPEEMNRRRKSLNELEFEHFLSLLSKARGEGLEVVFSDLIGIKEREFFYDGVKVIMRKKADSLFIPVSAASIVAKVVRDSLIEDLHKRYGDFGSGYLSDIKTREFLRRSNLKALLEGGLLRKRWDLSKILAGGVGYKLGQRILTEDI